MLEKYLNNRFFTLYLLPFFLGGITVFSFQPFNYTAVNFLVLSSLFYIIVYIKKRSKSKYRKKPFKKIYLFLEQFLDLVFFEWYTLDN